MIKDFLEIYWKFFKMGAVTFGGGYAMLPILRREVVENSHWMKEEDILDYCVVALIVDAVIGIVSQSVRRAAKVKQGGDEK